MKKIRRLEDFSLVMYIYINVLKTGHDQFGIDTDVYVWFSIVLILLIGCMLNIYILSLCGECDDPPGDGLITLTPIRGSG